MPQKLWHIHLRLPLSQLNFRNNFIVLSTAIFIILLGSCASTKKTTSLQAIQKENTELKKQLTDAITKNKELASKKKTDKELDSLSHKTITKFLDSIAAYYNSQKEAEEMPINKRIKKSEEDGKRLKTDLASTKIIGEVLQKKTFIRFECAALFTPGAYVINDELWKLASKSFSPVVDSLIDFTNKYPNTNFTSSIVILGYSDATAIDPNGNLYKVLTEQLGNPSADKASLNLQLSQLRANAVSNVFEELLVIKTCKDNLYKKLNLTLYGFGRGEELPDPALKGIADDDPRRRVVVVYWNVLPQ